MRRTILMMLLLVVSGGAAAEWVQVGGNESSTSYADPATIRKTGDMVKMWNLLDFKTAQARPYGTPYLSQKTQQEYDCKEGRARIIDLLRYSENMGTGEITSSESDSGKWEPVPPGTVSEALWELACDKR
ncbi:MAG: hypothetical protein HY067_04530 [Betaproteobacteria bacterium]|nr:hypothetical protein [Betaproteobacteria bacterium]